MTRSEFWPLTFLCRASNLAVVNRLFAAITLAVWSACYVSCAAGKGNASPTQDTAACCKHEQPAGTGSSEEDIPCNICDAILYGGLILSQPLVMAAVLWAFVLVTMAMPAAWRHLAEEAESRFLHRIPDPPWRLSRLWEFLVRTGCPVRGPSLVLA